MPWHKVQGHGECTDAHPWAVVKDATGEVEGCHANESDADDQLAALYAGEDGSNNVTETVVVDESSIDVATNATTAAYDDDCSDKQRRMPDGSCMSDDELSAASRWSGVLVVEGITTGDGREFAPNALTWTDHLLLRWQKEGAHGGEHDVTVTVGRIDEVWRNGEKIYGRGELDLLNPDGFELYRRMQNGFAGGISIDADDIADADVEFIWADNPEREEIDDEGADLLRVLFAAPEKMIFHAGRIRAATVVDIPAFIEAHISLGDNADALAAAAVVGNEHDVTTSDAAWSRSEHERRLPITSTDEIARRAYAWIDDSERLFLHHEVDDDGVPGPANVTACAAALAELDEDDAVSDAQHNVIYAHLAAHLRAAGVEPPPTTNVVAAVELNERRPLAAWFADPKLSIYTGITVTDQGRVYGHAAPWGECHIGFTEECITPPHESDHPYYLTGEVICADGSRVAVGQITVGTGHAPLSYRASRAVEHYDNTGSAVADVVVGNDTHGIWVAGAIRSHADAARVYDLRASGRVSGDWRRIGGQLRLVGLLAVNVPGFPIPRLRARVASGVPTALVAAGTHLILGRTPVPSEEELNQSALRRVMDLLAHRMTREIEEVG